MSIAAEVIDVRGTLGVKGVKRVRCRVIDDSDRSKVLTRNVAGPVHIGDVLLIKETGVDSEGRFA